MEFILKEEKTPYFYSDAQTEKNMQVLIFVCQN